MFGGQRRRGARAPVGAVVRGRKCCTLRECRGHTHFTCGSPLPRTHAEAPRAAAVRVGPLGAGSWRALIPRKARGPRVGPERLPRRARPPAGLGRAEFQLLPASSAAPVCVLRAPDLPSDCPAHVSCQPRARPRSPQSPGPLHTPNPDSPEGKSHWPRLPCLGRVCMPSH